MKHVRSFIEQLLYSAAWYNFGRFFFTENGAIYFLDGQKSFIANYSLLIFDYEISRLSFSLHEWRLREESLDVFQL